MIILCIVLDWPFAPLKPLLDTSQWSCFFPSSKSVCVCVCGEVPLLMSKQSLKKTQYRFCRGLLNHFGMSLSSEAVSQEDLPGGTAKGIQTPALHHFFPDPL